MMSHTNCDVISCPADMRHYENAEQRYKMLKTKVFPAFLNTVVMVEYKLTTYMVRAFVVSTVIRYSTSCALATTTAQTASWSIPILKHSATENAVISRQKSTQSYYNTISRGRCCLQSMVLLIYQMQFTYCCGKYTQACFSDELLPQLKTAT